MTSSTTIQTSGPAVPPLPVTPFASIATNWSAVTPPSTPGCISTAPDTLEASADTLWVGSADGLLTYSIITAAWTAVSPDILSSVAAISATEAFGIISGSPSEIVHYQSKNRSTLPALPHGDAPTAIAAAPGGALWVNGFNGCYRWNGSAWIDIPTAGYFLTFLSAGSAANAWAIGRSLTHANPVLLRYSEPEGWSPAPGFTGKTPNAVAVAADGSVWVALAESPNFQVSLDGAIWRPVPMAAPAGTFLDFAAASRYRAYCLTVAGLTFPPTLGCLSFGIVDQPAIPWPAFTPGQQNAYDAISQLLLTVPGSLRDNYDNSLVSLSDWYSTLSGESWDAFSQWWATLPDKPPIFESDFDLVKSQLLAEIEFVQGVNQLFSQILCLNGSIQDLNNTVLGSVYPMVGLTAPTDSDGSKTVIAVFGAIVEALAWGIAGAAAIIQPEIGIAMAFALGAGASLIGSGVDALSGLTPPSPDDRYTQLTTTYYDLTQNRLLKLYEAAAKANAASQTAAVTDWGRLQVIGRATQTALWRWPDATSPAIASYAQNAYEVWFYQVLMGAKWQIAYCQWPNAAGAYPNFTPANVTYVEDNTALGVQNVYFCVEIGGNYDLLNPAGLGPFPKCELMDAIWSLGVSPADFFKGRNGWNLARQKAC